jgi:hypothetical protein
MLHMYMCMSTHTLSKHTHCKLDVWFHAETPCRYTGTDTALVSHTTYVHVLALTVSAPRVQVNLHAKLGSPCYTTYESTSLPGSASSLSP